MIGGRSTEDHARVVGPGERLIVGMVRRLVVTLSETGIWQLGGFRAVKEALQAEAFQALGLWARPAGGAAIEAIVVNVGGDANHPVMIACRDEATRAAVAAAVLADTTILHNTKVGVYCTPESTIDARTHNGEARPLAFADELDALRAYVVRQFSTVGGHTHAVVGAATTTTTATATAGTPPASSPAPVIGTVVLKGE